MPNDIAFKRINGWLESGIAKQWYQFEKRVKAYADMLMLAHLPSEPKKLELNDNIVVVFYVHAALLFVSTVAYLIEWLTLMLTYRVILFFTKNVVELHA